MLEIEKESYSQAIQALQGKLEPANKILAAKDFRHISQGDHESVADFIRRLEHTFKIAYGRDCMSQETRNTLLHGQLQDGLRYEIMKAPAVSGAQNYPELCLASRNEEKLLLELKKREQYRQMNIPQFGLPEHQTHLVFQMQTGHILLHLPQIIEKGKILRVRNVIYVGKLVTYSGIADARIRNQRVPQKLRDQELVG